MVTRHDGLMNNVMSVGVSRSGAEHDQAARRRRHLFNLDCDRSALKFLLSANCTSLGSNIFDLFGLAAYVSRKANGVHKCCVPNVMLCAVLLAGLALALAGNPSYPYFSDYNGLPYTVTYDQRALKINGQHALFISGSIHPPRGTPEMWDVWFARAKENGLNMIEVYIFWNYHEPTEGLYDWSGRGNLTLFMETAAQYGMFVNLRIGPYVCAEWTYGGIPAWLGLKEGVAFRQSNAVWQPAMEKWFNVVVQLMAAGKFFATQGGPIVLVQVENELPAYDMPYVEWCGQMAHAALNAVNVDVPITSKTISRYCLSSQCATARLPTPPSIHATETTARVSWSTMGRTAVCSRISLACGRKTREASRLGVGHLRQARYRA